MVEIVPSILSADFTRLGEEISCVANGGATMLHLDVMDGHFVDNLTIGPPVVESVRKATKLHLDVHLMISNPARYAPLFAAAGADCISWHVECDDKPAAVLASIQAHKKIKKGIALKPGTPLRRITGLLKKVDFALVMSVEPGFGGQKRLSGLSQDRDQVGGPGVA